MMMAPSASLHLRVGIIMQVVVALIMSVMVAVGVAGQEFDPSNHASLYIDGQGDVRLSAASNATLYFNDMDLVTAVVQQQELLAAQQAVIAEQQQTISTLSSSLNALPCRAFHPIPYPAAEYFYGSEVLGFGVRVDYTSQHLFVGGLGSYKWRTALLAPNGLVYTAPSNSDSLLVIDPATNTIDTTLVNVTNTGFAWYGIVAADNGKLYFIPVVSDTVLIVDPNTNHTVDQTSIAGLDGQGYRWWGGAKAPNNGKIYCTPFDVSFVLIIDPSNDTADTTTIANLPSGSSWVDAVLHSNGLIYGMPYHNDYLLIINPLSDTAQHNTVMVASGNSKWLGGVLANNGKIYGIPSYADKVLVIDPPNNNAISFINIAHPMIQDKWFGGVLTANGKIIGFPRNAEAILIIDTETHAIDTTSLPVPAGIEKWVGGVYIPQYNRIYGIPEKMDHVLQIDLDPCFPEK